MFAKPFYCFSENILPLSGLKRCVFFSYVTRPRVFDDQTRLKHEYPTITEKMVSIRKGKEMLYLTTHSTHFIYGYMASDIIMVKDHSDSERGNPLPPPGLLVSINSKGSFICTIPQTGLHIPRPLLHQSWSTGWNEKWVHPMKDRSDDPSHRERTLLPRSYISLLVKYKE